MNRWVYNIFYLVIINFLPNMQAELPTVSVNHKLPKPSGIYKKKLLKNLKHSLDNLDLTATEIESTILTDSQIANIKTVTRGLSEWFFPGFSLTILPPLTSLGLFLKHFHQLWQASIGSSSTIALFGIRKAKDYANW